MKTADVIVIGGGIAGASAAAEIAAAGAQVLLLEMESQPGYHATGRSAAMYEPSEGAPMVRALTRASYTFLSQPPEGLVEVPLLSEAALAAPPAVAAAHRRRCRRWP